jgi:hypothetical protein
MTRRLTAEGDPVTRMAVVRDRDTGAALWAGPVDQVAAAVRAIREGERSSAA